MYIVSLYIHMYVYVMCMMTKLPYNHTVRVKHLMTLNLVSR